MARAEGLWPPGPGSHLLLLDAVVLRDHEEELRGEVTLREAVAAEPVQEREYKLRVLGHAQVLVQGLCQRGLAEGHSVSSHPALPGLGALLLPTDGPNARDMALQATKKGPT